MFSDTINITAHIKRPNFPEKKGHLAAKNFIIRLLYKETY